MTDFYILFYFRFIKANRYNDEQFWKNSIDTPQHNAWAGYSFEMLCLNHIRQLKTALGIAGVQTLTSSWRSTNAECEAQIDLIIDRKDQTINFGEMKYSTDEYVISKSYEAELRNKKSSFIAETKKAVHLTMVTTYGVKQSLYSDKVQSEVALEDLFPMMNTTSRCPQNHPRRPSGHFSVRSPDGGRI